MKSFTRMAISVPALAITLLCLYGIPGQVEAETEFSCSVDAFDNDDNPIDSPRFRCSAIVVYFDMDSSEEQELIRWCRFRPGESECTKVFDDSGVYVGTPTTAAIRSYSHASVNRKYSKRGCVQTPSELYTGGDESYFYVEINQFLRCGS